ncbi:MAG TPA: amidohydrolase family protein, partial [Gemmatimonadaceae bacterium]|nr:amidohydrolase family protein [Gemmatimonadaceae bacterium]
TLGIITADTLIAALDAAGIRRALILSVAYQFGNPNQPAVADEYAQVRAENDWTSQQVARFPDRLKAFCGFNPLKDYALDELARCSKDPNLRSGIKLHFGNSDVDLRNPQHVAKLKTVFQAANQHRMAIAVHMHPSTSMRRPYSAAQATAFLTEVLPAAPNVPVQIAHLTGAGTYDDPATDEALGVFVAAIANHDRRMTNVYFDISGIAGVGKWTERANVIVARIREIGIEHILYGSDAMAGGSTPKTMSTAFRQLPLTDAEFHTIEGNMTSYMK